MYLKSVIKKIKPKVNFVVKKIKPRAKKLIFVLTLSYILTFGSLNSPGEISPGFSPDQVFKIDAKSDQDSYTHIIGENNEVVILSHNAILNEEFPTETFKPEVELRGGELGNSKSGPGARAKADARRSYSSGSSLIPGVDGFVPQRAFFHSYDNTAFKKRVAYNERFAYQGNGNYPPPGDGKSSGVGEFKGGPNPFAGKFDYKNPKHTPQTTDFSNKRRMSHSYAKHAKKCFNIQQNQNKASLNTFETSLRNYMEAPGTNRIEGCYRYEVPAYHYRNPAEDLVVTINATNNEFISVRNATKPQLERLAIDGNLGLDTRPNMTDMVLRLRGGPGLPGVL